MLVAMSNTQSTKETTEGSQAIRTGRGDAEGPKAYCSCIKR